MDTFNTCFENLKTDHDLANKFNLVKLVTMNKIEGQIQYAKNIAKYNFA